MLANMKLTVSMIFFIFLSFSQVEGRKHSSNSEDRNPPTYDELAAAVSAGLASLARTAHRPISRLGIDTPLDPLQSSSELKYVHEGDLLRLKLVLDNVTLVGFKTLTVQEVNFKTPNDEDMYAGLPWTSDTGEHDYRGEDDDDDNTDYDYADWNHGGGGGGGGGDLYNYEDWSRLAMQDSPASSNGRYQGRNERSTRRNSHSSTDLSSVEGTIRVAFKQMAVKAKYQVRGSAGGFFTFREAGDLTLTSPTVFLTTRLNVTLPGFGHQHQTAIPRHGRVKVLWARSNVSIGSTSLNLQPGAYPPAWVRQQVQSKLEELSSDLSHGHGAVRLLLRRWGRLVKRLIHRTARSLTK